MHYKIFHYRISYRLYNTDENVAEQQPPDDEVPNGNAGQADLPADPVPPIQQQDRYLLLRVATFAMLPRSVVAESRPLTLARLGFFYIGRSSLRCFYCGVDVPLQLHGGHHDESSTLDQHRTLSPDCTLTGPGNPREEVAARSLVQLWALRIDVRQEGIGYQHSLNIDWR